MTVDRTDPDRTDPNRMDPDRMDPAAPTWSEPTEVVAGAPLAPAPAGDHAWPTAGGWPADAPTTQIVTSVDALDVATSFHADGPALRPAATVTESGPALTTTTAASVTHSHQEVTCPDCGETTAISINRRESEDFCPHCDYPLFWIVTNVVIDSTSANSGSLRRLPGTAGRAQRAGIECPTCDEVNSPTALICSRCGGPMKLVEPVYEPPPPPPAPVIEPLWAEPEPEPRRNLLWLWIVLGVLGAGLVAWTTVGLLNALIP